MSDKHLTPQQKALIRRYLIWDYKTTREAFERIERKTTQLMVDKYVYAKLPASVHRDEFGKYIANKEQDEIKLKYTSAKKKSFDSKYLYLKDRLKGLERAIEHFLGKKELKAIEGMFEEEFTRRILESKDH